MNIIFSFHQLKNKQVEFCTTRLASYFWFISQNESGNDVVVAVNGGIFCETITMLSERSSTIKISLLRMDKHIINKFVLKLCFI